MSKVLFLLSLCITILFSGCKSFDEYQQDRVSYAVQHFERAKRSNIDETQVLTLKECIRLAIRNNLDLKVLGLEEQVAEEMHTSELLGMLPELNISNNYSERDNTPGSSSKNIYGQSGGTYSYSQSQDRQQNVFNIDLALSVLDFGLAFFNSQQAKDRVFLRNQRLRRAEQNLVLDVARVYFQVAVAQRAIVLTQELLDECRARFAVIEDLGDRGVITPFRAFEETRRLIEMEKKLTNYFRSYDNSRVELCSLLGLYADTKIKVDYSMLNNVPEFTFPDMELMEQIALMRRPELFEIDIQKHINAIECRKSILMMFPNVRLFADYNKTNSDFQYHTSWWEVGVRAAYNLLKLPQHISRYKSYSKQVDVEEERAYAQAIAIIAQVRIAHANFLATKERLDIDIKINSTYKKNLEKAMMNKKMIGELSQLEIDHIRLATKETEIEKDLSLGNYFVSYFRILNTLGVENLDVQTVKNFKEALSYEHVLNSGNFKTQKREYYAGDEVVKEYGEDGQSSKRVGKDDVFDEDSETVTRPTEARPGYMTPYNPENTGETTIY
jgi:outer membrane protein TolC